MKYKTIDYAMLLNGRLPISPMEIELADMLLDIKKKEKPIKGEVKRTFNLFWDHWHKITKEPKVERARSEKIWSKMTLDEWKLAYLNARPFINQQLKKYGDIKFVKIARTYLSDKNYNDEIKTKNKEGVMEGSFFKKKIPHA